MSEEKEKESSNSYWGNAWKIGSRILVSDGDWSIGWGIILGFSDSEKLWAIVKLEDVSADMKGYCYNSQPGIVNGYKGYCYREAEK